MPSVAFLNNNVTHRINDVGIVTDTADQSVSAIRTVKGIVASATIEEVVAPVTGEGVVQVVTANIHARRGIGNSGILDVGTQYISARRREGNIDLVPCLRSYSQ